MGYGYPLEANCEKKVTLQFPVLAKSSFLGNRSIEAARQIRPAPNALEIISYIASHRTIKFDAHHDVDNIYYINNIILPSLASSPMVSLTS